MKKTVFTFAIAFFSITTLLAKPYYAKGCQNQPKVIVVKPKCPSPNHIWVDGDWKWNNVSQSYVFINGYWAENKPNNVYVQGHWRQTKYGNKWIPGHWK